MRGISQSAVLLRGENFLFSVYVFHQLRFSSLIVRCCRFIEFAKFILTELMSLRRTHKSQRARERMRRGLNRCWARVNEFRRNLLKLSRIESTPQFRPTMHPARENVSSLCVSFFFRCVTHSRCSLILHFMRFSCECDIAAVAWV